MSRDFTPLSKGKGREEIPVNRESSPVGDVSILPFESGILDILSNHVTSYIELHTFVSQHYLIPSALLTAKGLDVLNKEFNQNSNILLEAIAFADTVSLLDISRGGVGNNIFRSIGDIISINRDTILGRESLLVKEENDRGRGGRNTISRNSAKVSFNIKDFDHDHVLMAIYLFCLVCNLYKKYIIIEEKDVR